MYYEAFLNVLRHQRWDYDHFAKLPDSRDSYDFDQTLGNSPRDKPAEAVVKLWFGSM